MIMIYIKVKLLRLVWNISGLCTQISSKMDLERTFFWPSFFLRPLSFYNLCLDYLFMFFLYISFFHNIDLF